VNLLLSALVLVVAYLLGSIPVGMLLVRATTGKDIRKIGSGRTGGTNVLRAAGSRVALVVVLLDVAKGLLPVLLARVVVGSPAIEALAGLFAVAGHNYSIFINFRGGAGTMTTIGGALGLWPWSVAAVTVAGILAIAVTRQASVGSITVALVIPIVFVLRASVVDAPWAHLIQGLGTAALTLWSLRPNIKRLLEGNERKLSFSKSA
jgi:glycerol-3-phosphate acyltransferase PlsY